jgi:hypothetical protein
MTEITKPTIVSPPPDLVVRYVASEQDPKRFTYIALPTVEGEYGAEFLQTARLVEVLEDVRKTLRAAYPTRQIYDVEFRKDSAYGQAMDNVGKSRVFSYHGDGTWTSPIKESP